MQKSNNDKPLNIYQKLLKITEDAEQIPKNGYNSFSKYNYVRAVDLISHVKSLLIKYGVHVTITEDCHERNMHGKNFHSKISCVGTFVNIDNPTERHDVPFFTVAADTLDKDIFKAKTAGLKYLFTSEFKILSDDVKDIEEQKTSHNENDNLQMISDKQIINLREICESKGFPPDETLKSLAQKVYNIKKIEDLPETCFKDAFERINKKEAE